MLPYEVRKKIVKSGKFIEIYEYGKPYWVGFPRLRRLRPAPKIQRDQEKIRADNVNRTRKKIKRIVNSNPQLNCFLTLTFAKEITELKQANPIFNNFTKRMLNKYSNFEYLAVPEFQKRGRVHYHVACKFNLPEFKDKEDEREFERWFAKNLWRNGFIDVRPISNVKNIGSYISKYLGKEMFDKRFFRKKKFFYSKTLNMPEVYRKRREIKEFTDFFEPETMKPVFESDFYSKHTGDTTYKVYALEDINNIEELKGFLMPEDNP
ncbi:hypothetical protein ISS03_04965 [Patescibacteria group bacterium]|nr:hypothetical protein [Patescibacteria group bacterium]